MCKSVFAKAAHPVAAEERGICHAMICLVESLEQERVCVCVCERLCGEKCIPWMVFVFSIKIYAVKGLKVVFSQTLVICSAKQ